jgi:hypothetical protein
LAPISGSLEDRFPDDDPLDQSHAGLDALDQSLKIGYDGVVAVASAVGLGRSSTGCLFRMSALLARLFMDRALLVR